MFPGIRLALRQGRFVYVNCSKTRITTPNSLGKNERLKSYKLIRQVFREGEVISVSPFRIPYIFTTDGPPLQAGFTVSSRHFKRAVDRNRIKRLVREAYRVQKAALKVLLESKKLHLAVFFIYTGREMPAAEIIQQKMEKGIRSLIKITDAAT